MSIATSKLRAVDVLLPRLDGVRPSGEGRYMARCPGPLHEHGDRNRSLSIRDNSGSVLLHCFAGCAALDVVNALGLNLADLFDHPAPDDGTAPARINPFAKEDLAQLRHLAIVLWLASVDLGRGKALGSIDQSAVTRALRELLGMIDRLVTFERPRRGRRQ